MGAGPGPGVGLWPFSVPVLRLAPGPALDTLLALSDLRAPEVSVGESVHAMAAVAGVALEIVAGGRVVPGLALDGTSDGRPRYIARWAPIGGGRDDERLRLVAGSLPPVCRAVDPGPGHGKVFSGSDPEDLVRSALGAFVDVTCREAVRRAGRRLSPFTRAASRPRPAPIEAWLAALAAPGPEVDADPGELAKLERLTDEWRAGVVGRGGPWRLCFRLCEPDDDQGEADAEQGEPGGGVSGQPGGGASGQPEVRQPENSQPEIWRVQLLLQATDEPSLVVEADEVWRSGAVLRRAARALEAPHEVLLAELGRARCAYPELSAALRQAAPTALELDLLAAYRFLAEVAPTLEVAGFGVLLPAWWRHPTARLGARLRARPASAGGTGTGLLSEDGVCAFDWEAALGTEPLSLSELEEFARLKAPLVRARGKWLELRPGEAEKLAEFLRSGRGYVGTMKVTDLVRVAAGVDDGGSGEVITGVDAEGLLGALLRGELADHLEVRRTPGGFAGELRPYQQRGVAWMELLERTGVGACLADDMGLGKTAMVLALLASERQDQGLGGEQHAELGPTLVVCPTSVVGNWKREAERFVPELKVHVHHGTSRARAG